MLDGKVKNSRFPVNYHITPLEGLLNDPNGLCFYQGFYHVYYQLNPKGTDHKNKCWGHVKSKDLVHWVREPIALAPSEWYDKDGIYSGSAIVVGELLYVFYTGNVIQADDSRKSYQCVAVSKDGQTFEKLGPVIEEIVGYTRHVRDPKVWYDELEKCYYMVLGAQKNDEVGTILLYSSVDLFNWESQGELLANNEIKKIAQRGYMWECPDLFTLDNEQLLIYSPQGIEQKEHQFANLYQTILLRLAKNNEKYTIKNEKMIELDWGFEFYAPQTFEAPDGRRILFGWAGVMPERDETVAPTIAEGWIHHLTIPRELSFKEGKLLQKPVTELKQLRTTTRQYTLEKQWQETSLKNELELLVLFEETAIDFELRIKETTRLSYNAEKKQFCLQRLNWATGKKEKRLTYLDRPVQKIHAYLDGSSLELFINQGESVATARFFEEGPMSITYVGGNSGKAEVYELK
ncbi:glycoside hydrolase family 32 protein [Enterococcus sp. LJL99]